MTIRPTIGGKIGRRFPRGKIGWGLTLLELGYEKLKEMRKGKTKRIYKPRKEGDVLKRQKPVKRKKKDSKAKKVAKDIAIGTGIGAASAAAGYKYGDKIIPDGPIDKKNKRLLKELKQQKRDKKKKVAVKKKKVIKYPPPKRK